MLGVSTIFANRIHADATKLSIESTLPLPSHIRLREYVLKNAEWSAEADEASMTKHWEKAREDLVALSKKLEGRTEELRRNLDPRVVKMWGDAHLGLMEHIVKNADPENGAKVADFILRGVPTYGTFPETCSFEKMTADQTKNYERKTTEAKKKFTTKQKTKIPDWVSSEDLKEAFQVFLKKAKNPVEIFEDYDKLKDPVFCFPVKQGDRQYQKDTRTWKYSKIRPCMDYRAYNCLTWISNKMSYGGQELVIRCCLKFLALEPDYRLASRKQVHENVTTEIAKKDKAISGGRVLKKVRPMQNRSPRPFAIAKADFANYYYWFPSRTEYDVVICDGEKYRYFRIGHASFGSLQAIFVATVFSEALCHFINTVLGLCATVYIDDIILVEPLNMIGMALNLLLLLFSLIRLPVQGEKVETLLPTPVSFVPEEAFRVLGLQSTICQDPLQLMISVPNVKKQSIMHEANLAVELITEGALTLQVIQSVTGQLVSALFFQRHSFVFAKMRPLFVASCERRFPSVIKSKPFRMLLVDTLETMANIVVRAKPVKFTCDDSQRRLAIAYTDASLEPCDDGTKTAVVAGLFFFTEADGEVTNHIRFPFSYVIQEAQHDIAVYEAVALMLALDRFPKKLNKRFRISVGVDNTNTLFALAKAMSGNLTLSAATSIMVETMCEGASFFFVPSKQNIADVLARSERSSEIDENLFVEKVRAQISDLDPFLKRIDKRVAEIRYYYAQDNHAKRRKR